jgi:lysophospholipase L1-like esterase
MARYLALGDSYTIGEGVTAEARWPLQLVELLRQGGMRVEDPIIVARTGWTTGELLSGIETAGPRGPFDLVSVLVGVNNQYRALDIEQYRDEFRLLLNLAVQYAGGEPGRVIVLSIPDWGVTPFAKGQNRARIAAEIDMFNAVNRAEAKAIGALYLDVTSISRNAGADQTLLAADGLHPSAEMYAAWARLALPSVLAALEEGTP